jgi:pyoverdine/dityrosine biosynthesis protein Dit1
MQKNKLIKQIFVIKIRLKILKRNAVGVDKTGSKVLAADTGYTDSVFHTNTNVSTAIGSYSTRKRTKFIKDSKIFLYCKLHP